MQNQTHSLKKKTFLLLITSLIVFGFQLKYFAVLFSCPRFFFFVRLPYFNTYHIEHRHLKGLKISKLYQEDITDTLIFTILIIPNVNLKPQK